MKIQASIQLNKTFTVIAGNTVVSKLLLLL